MSRSDPARSACTVRAFERFQGSCTVAEPESEHAHVRPALRQAEVVARGVERRHVALDLRQGRPHRELRVEVVQQQGPLDRDARDHRVGARIRRSDGRSLEELERSFELTAVDTAPVRGTASPRGHAGRRPAATSIARRRSRSAPATSPRPSARSPAASRCPPRARGDRAAGIVDGTELLQVPVRLLEVVPHELVQLAAGPGLSLEPIREPFVQRCAEFLRHRLVHGIPDQQMPEPIGVFFAEVATVRADQVLPEEGPDPLVDRAAQLLARERSDRGRLRTPCR